MNDTDIHLNAPAHDHEGPCWTTCPNRIYYTEIWAQRREERMQAMMEVNPALKAFIEELKEHPYIKAIERELGPKKPNIFQRIWRKIF